MVTELEALIFPKNFNFDIYYLRRILTTWCGWISDHMLVMGEGWAVGGEGKAAYNIPSSLSQGIHRLLGINTYKSNLNS